MKHLPLLFLLLPFCALSQDCLEFPKGVFLTEKRDVEPIKGIELRIDAEVVPSIGMPQQVKLVAEIKVMEQITTEVVDGILIIDWKHCVDEHEKIIIYVTAREFTKLESTGKGKIRQPAGKK